MFQFAMKPSGFPTLNSGRGYLFRAVTLAVLGFAFTAPIRAAGVTVSVVHVFHHVANGVEGEWPGPVLALPGGMLYGTTEEGGRYGVGTVFALHQDGQLVTLHTFGGPDGAYPDPCLLVGADDAVYGTTGATGLGAALGTKRIFRISKQGEYSTVAVLYRPVSPGGDRWSALLEGTDGRLYAVTNYDSMSFELVGLEHSGASIPAFRVVHRLVGSSGWVSLNAKGLQQEMTEAARDIVKYGGKATSNQGSGNWTQIQCGDTTIAPDGHLWTPAMNGHGAWRSVSTDLRDGYYEPVAAYLSKINSFNGPLSWHLGKANFNTPVTPVENPAYPEAASAFGRFAGAPHDSIWATSRGIIPPRQEGPYEIIEVSPIGQIVRRIVLGILGQDFSPFGGLVNGSGGYVYGLAYSAANEGTVVLYRFSPDQLTPHGPVDVIHQFTDTGWIVPFRAELVVGGDGNLYVTFPRGGQYKQGVIYRVEVGH